MLFPLSTVYLEKIQETGLTTNYTRDKTFALEIKKLSALAFVPLKDVIPAYEYLLETPFFNQQILEAFLTYFKVTWIGAIYRGNKRRDPMFAITIWNQSSNIAKGLNKTNNAVKGFHNGFNHLIGAAQCAHPTIWKLIDASKKQQSLIDLRIEQHLRGDQQQPKKQKYKDQETRLENLVQSYDFKEIDQYLRGIAHNIHYQIID